MLRNRNDYKKEYDEVAIEVIRFLKKWGMWSATMIFTNGNMYEATSDEKDIFMGESRVKVTKNVSYEEYIKGMSTNDRVCCVSPGHVFDMVYEGPLYGLIGFDEYKVKASAISKEAWKEIFAGSGILAEYMLETYDLRTKEELFKRVVSSKDILDDPEKGSWDPLVFDTWEEYMELSNYSDKDLPNVTDDYDNYEQYESARDEVITMEDIEPLWERMLYKAKRAIKSENRELSFPDMAVKIKDAFLDIFESHDLWHEYGFRWSLSAYPTDRSNEEEPWWERLDEVKTEDLDELYHEIPDGLIMYRDEPYFLINVKKRIEYSSNNVIDDVQFDVYEDGLSLRITLIQCGTGERKDWNIRIYDKERSCLEFFKDYNLKIPDKKTRKMIRSFLKNGKHELKERPAGTDMQDGRE